MDMASQDTKYDVELLPGRKGVRCLPRPGQSVLARCVPRVHHEEVPDIAPHPSGI